MTDGRGGVTILVVDDEPGVRTLLRECFEQDGFQVVEAKDGRELDAQLADKPVGLVTLDINLGGENGFDLARRIRSARNVPIIMITGKGDPIDRVVGLELGADDYISKPFHLREVVARVRAVLRRYEASADQVPSQAVEAAGSPQYAFGGWVLDTGRRDLRSKEGELRELTTAEYDLLLLLLERPSRVMSRDDIMDLLKGHEWSPYDRSIDSLIVRLRRKIEAVPDQPRLVKTVRGVGYVFAGEVEKL